MLVEISFKSRSPASVVKSTSLNSVPVGTVIVTSYLFSFPKPKKFILKRRIFFLLITDNLPSSREISGILSSGKL